MSVPAPLSVPNESRPGLPAPLAATVALASRLGADRIPVGTLGAAPAPFWQALLAHAERLSVLGVVLVELSRSGLLEELKSVPNTDAAGHLRRLRRQAALWDLEREEVLRRLAQAEVPVVLLKGGALGLTAYTDPAQRAFGDLDVLVPERLLHSAVTALTEGGYEQEGENRVKLYLEHHHHLILRKPQGFVVEVHWALVPVGSPFRLDADAFLRDARVVTTPGGARVAVPAPEHMVLHLAQQNLEDGFSQLRRLVDVDRVIAGAGDFDWARLASESQRMRVQGVVALTLRLAELLFGAAVPDGFMKELGLTNAARAHLALLDPVGLVLAQRGQRRAVHELLLIWCLPDARTRLRTLKEMATGEWGRSWLLIETGGAAGRAGTRLAALSKLAAYQTAVYLAGLFRLGAGAKRRRGFWG